MAAMMAFPSLEGEAFRSFVPVALAVLAISWLMLMKGVRALALDGELALSMQLRWCMVEASEQALLGVGAATHLPQLQATPSSPLTFPSANVSSLW